MRNGCLAGLMVGLFCVGCGQTPPPSQQESPRPVAVATSAAPVTEPNPTAEPAPSAPAPVVPNGAVEQPAPPSRDTPYLVLDSGGHSAPLNRVLFTPDGREVITVSADKTIRVWDTALGETVRVLRLPIGPGEEGRLDSADLSKDGRMLAVARRGAREDDTTIYLITLASGRIERVIPARTHGIKSLALSPDGKWLAAGGEDLVVRLWDVASGKCVRELSAIKRKGRIIGLAFSSDSKHLLTGFHKWAGVWNVTTGKNVIVLNVVSKTNNCVAWSPDGKSFAVGGGEKVKSDDPDKAAKYQGGGIGVYNADGTLRKRLDCPQTSVEALTFTDDSHALLVGGRRGYCAVLDLDGKERGKFTGRGGPVLKTLALAPGHRLAATAAKDDDEVFLWKTADAAIVHRLGGKGRKGQSVGWSPDGLTVAWGNTNVNRVGQAKDFETNERGPLERTFSLTDLEIGRVADAKFRRARTTLGALSLKKVNPGTVAVKQGKETVTTLRFGPVAGVGVAVSCFTLLPGDRTMLGGANGHLGLFDTRNGKRLRTFQASNAVYALAPSPDNRYVLTGDADQALRIWDPERAAPLLSLFVAGDEWIAWTPEGYYAASPGGERFMGWQVNNRPDQLATFHPAARFHNSLYRPDVIKLLLKTGSVARALEVADRERGKTTQQMDVADVLPPTVLATVTTPDPNKPQDVKVEAVAQASSKHPVTGLRLMLDGRPHGGDKALRKVAQPGPAPVRETWLLTLPPGTQQVAVLAETAINKSLSEPVEIVMSRGLKPVPMAPEKLKQQLPRLHVLAIGISAYPGKLGLRFAAKDATVLAKTFAITGKDLFQDVKVDLLVDAQAKRADILDRLEKLPDQVREGDVAVITFAGHGDRDATGKFYLLPVDANPKKMLSTCVDGDQIKSVLASLPCKVILVLDACHSGAVGGVVSNLVRDLVTEDHGVIVMCAAMGKEVALANNKVGHGFFTKALVEGLSGKAKSDDGQVYLHRLDAYLYDRVKELSNDQQHPAITRPTSIRSFAIARP